MSLEDKLNIACISGNLEVVKYLVSQGADIHAENDRALLRASNFGYLEIVKFLVSQGANIYVLDKYALRWAKIWNHIEIENYLKDQMIKDKLLAVDKL